MAMCAYSFYVNEKDHQDMFQCTVEVAGRWTELSLKTTYETDGEVKETHKLCLSPNCSNRVLRIGNIVRQVFPKYFDYDMNQIGALHIKYLHCLYDDSCPEDIKKNAGSFILANRIFQNVNMCFKTRMISRVNKMQANYQNIPLALEGEESSSTETELKRQDFLDFIVKAHVRPLALKFNEYFIHVPSNPLSERVGQASRLLDCIPQNIQNSRIVNKLCQRILQALSS